MAGQSLPCRSSCGRAGTARRKAGHSREPSSRSRSSRHQSGFVQVDTCRRRRLYRRPGASASRPPEYHGGETHGFGCRQQHRRFVALGLRVTSLRALKRNAPFRAFASGARGRSLHKQTAPSAACRLAASRARCAGQRVVLRQGVENEIAGRVAARASRGFSRLEHRPSRSRRARAVSLRIGRALFRGPRNQRLRRPLLSPQRGAASPAKARRCDRT